MGPKLTTCTFCGVGCGIYLETSENRIAGAYPSMSHPANQGRICVRGWHVHEVASSPDRLKRPLIRRNGELQEASWDEAYGFVAERLAQVKSKHGPDSIGFLSSPRCSNEETYLLQKLARSLVGTNNVDHGMSFHRTKTIQVLTDMLGIPAATSSIGELSKSEAIVVDGIDLVRQLPTVGGAVLRAKLNGAKLIVSGTRRHRLVESADHFLQVRPKTTVCLYGAMAKIIVDRGLMDLKFIKSRCRDYDAFLDRVQHYDVLWAAERCGIDPDLIEAAALTFANARSAMILYSSGVEARGVEPIQAMVDLALLTGNIGREGAGIMPLTEHNNLQGACDMGMLPDLLPGYEPVARPESRARFESAWNARIPESPGRAAADLLGPGGRGKLKALWLARHSPVLITSSFSGVGECLSGLDLMVYQHLFLTKTARYAHVVLPVVAFGEEQVTFTSTERRIQIADQVIDPPEGPVSAWKQIASVAGRLGASWSYDSAADVMAEIGQCVPAYEAASYDNLSRDYGRQWPCTRDKPMGTRCLFEDAAREKPFKFVLMEKPAIPPGAPKDFPFALVFGYSLFYWHKNVLVQHSETLKREHQIVLLDYPEGFVDLNVDDAGKLGIKDGARIRLISERGTAETHARVTNEVKAGMVFVPYFLQDIALQLFGEAGILDFSVSGQVYVRVEKA